MAASGPAPVLLSHRAPGAAPRRGNTL